MLDLTDERLRELLDLESRATAGPWEYRFSPDCRDPHSVFAGSTSVLHTPWNRDNEADTMRLAAAARNALRPLIAEVRALREQPRWVEGPPPGDGVYRIETTGGTWYIAEVTMHNESWWAPFDRKGGTFKDVAYHAPMVWPSHPAAPSQEKPVNESRDCNAPADWEGQCHQRTRELYAESQQLVEARAELGRCRDVLHKNYHGETELDGMPLSAALVAVLGEVGRSANDAAAELERLKGEVSRLKADAHAVITAECNEMMDEEFHRPASEYEIEWAKKFAGEWNVKETIRKLAMERDRAIAALEAARAGRELPADVAEAVRIATERFDHPEHVGTTFTKAVQRMADYIREVLSVPPPASEPFDTEICLPDQDDATPGEQACPIQAAMEATEMSEAEAAAYRLADQGDGPKLAIQPQAIPRATPPPAGDVRDIESLADELWCLSNIERFKTCGAWTAEAKRLIEAAIADHCRAVALHKERVIGHLMDITDYRLKRADAAEAAAAAIRNAALNLLMVSLPPHDVSGSEMFREAETTIRQSAAGHEFLKRWNAAESALAEAQRRAGKYKAALERIAAADAKGWSSEATQVHATAIAQAALAEEPSNG